jgi:hypothetical protein
MNYNQHWGLWKSTCLGKREEICMGICSNFLESRVLHEQQVENKTIRALEIEQEGWAKSRACSTIF